MRSVDHVSWHGPAIDASASWHVSCARCSSDVNATSMLAARKPRERSSWPAPTASTRPFTVSGTSHQPVKRVSGAPFQMDSPCRSRMSVEIFGRDMGVCPT